MLDHDLLGGARRTHTRPSGFADWAPRSDTLTLLKEPRLKLFEHVKFDLGTPGGEMAGRLTVHIPLEKDVGIDQIPIHGTGHVSKGHLSGIVANYKAQPSTIMASGCMTIVFVEAIFNRIDLIRS